MASITERTTRLVRLIPPPLPADNSSAEHLRLLASNPLYRELVSTAMRAKNGPCPASTMLPITATEHCLYSQREKARKRMVFIFEDYERRLSSLTQFEHVITAELARTEFSDTKSVYDIAKKGIMLDSMLEVVLSHMWKAVVEEYVYRNIFDAFGSRSILVWAALSQFDSSVSRVFRERLIGLKTVVVDKANYEKSFRVLCWLCSNDNDADDVDNRMKTVYNMSVSMNRRWDKYAALEDTNHCRKKMDSVYSKDMIVIPALYRLMEL